MAKLRIVPRGPYSLAASASFLCGFTPASGSSCSLDDGRLVLGFLDEVHHRPVTVALEQAASGDVTGEAVLPPGHRDEGAARAVERQVARLLSLDHDARGLATIAEHDAPVREMLAAMPGFRPVCFPSPYEAAVWGLLAQRITMPCAAKIKTRLAVATGTVAEGFGRSFHPAPAPEALLALRTFDGLPAEKLTRLHAVAVAALEGKLDAARLRVMSRERAIESLRSIRGVGPWTAEHVLLRGCGVVDELPAAEPRVLRAIAAAYDLRADASANDVLEIAERWRPYRMWIAVLLVMNLRRSIFPRSSRPRNARTSRACERASGLPSQGAGAL